MVELLIVIAIIAVLAALLFPVFGRSRAASHRITCLTNLRQINNALTMYVQDNDEVYPWLVCDGDGGQIDPGSGTSTAALTVGPPNLQGVTGLFMEYRLQPYAKSIGIFGCPANEPLPVPFNSAGLPLKPMHSYAYMYGGIGRQQSPFPDTVEQLVRGAPIAVAMGLPLNPISASGNPQDYCIAGQPLARVTYPSQVVTVMCNSYGKHEGYEAGDIIPVIFGGNGREEIGGTTQVFVDGHVKYRTGKFYDLVSGLLTPLH